MFVDLFINGLVEGCLLALICMGYSLAYGTAKIINFAHADVMICGGGYLVLLWLGGSGPAPAAPLLMALLFGAAASMTALLYLPRSARLRVLTAAAVGMTVALLTFGLTGRLPFYAATLLALPLTAMLAAAIYRTIYLPLLLRNAHRTSILLAALGTSIALQSWLLVGWNSGRRVFPVDRMPAGLTARAVPDASTLWQAVTEYGVFRLTGNHTLAALDFLIVVVFVLVVVGLALWFRFSRTADAMTAAADAPLAARACGIPVERIAGHAFVIGGAIASIGGTLYILRSKSLDPTAGLSPGILAFAACVLGGIGSLRGSVAGAFLTGLAISLAPAVPLERWAGKMMSPHIVGQLPSLRLSDWSYGVVYLFMILIILLKPRGLFAS